MGGVEQRRLPAAEPADYERALNGVDFPLSKPGLMRDVRENGGIDREVLEMIERLPADEWDDRESLIHDLHAAYLAEGYDESVIPI